MSATKIGHGLAKVLGIKLEYRNELDDEIRRGESVFSTNTADTYVEEEPTSAEWIRETLPSGHDLAVYARSLFPFTHWIGRYNLQWLAGDLVAGITIGAVVVPQGMAYATLADLPVQYGLYTSFMGVLIYWFFATSKDITIGPVAVVSTLVGKILVKAAKTHPTVPGPVIASAMAVIAGCIIFFIGLIRMGWIVDLIPLVSISAFMTGSALNIAVGQLPTLMGITGFDTRAATYLVFINWLKGLPRTKLDAAIGLTALFLLYAIRSACKFAAKKYPTQRKLIFFISTLRTAFVILLYTLVSWLVNRHHRKKPLFKILSTVPRGFTAAKVPTIDISIIKIFTSDLPVLVIVLLIEHIAISKSFGRVNNYVINPSQELVAIGITNILGPFLGAYPATGSFSRTAIKAKAGVRTPFAGVITAVVVLLAIYALTAVFFYIPSAALSAVIIHAVGDLITAPNTVYQFWRVSPLEVPIFFAGVLVTVFSSIENGIYTTICVSFALLVFRIIKAKGRFLGKVKVHSVVGDSLIGSESTPFINSNNPAKSGGSHEDVAVRNIFLPIDHGDGSNPDVEVATPYPGVFIYRFSEGFNYPNANHYLDQLTAHIFANTRRTNLDHYGRPGDRPWNDPGPRRGKAADDHPERPTLKAVILDFSSVNNVDITSVQTLIDVRNQLDRYTSPSVVDFHFASINNRWTKRALVAAGFGYPTILPGDNSVHRWKPIFSVAEIGGSDSAAQAAEINANEKDFRKSRTNERDADTISAGKDSELSSSDLKSSAIKTSSRAAVVNGLNRPLFHIDLTSALQSAIANVEARADFETGLPAPTATV
ncbi:putative sulfate permease 2 [Mollisia scopiformis]|uniref:Putative sulfate permease 2 n=1 Tax=Mollisia scopiformis TaxID=149040 RepID=A0A194XQ95_MOLSC|nr:putative sulfate permease 2 [Mollisia scopiformis]KUJ22430.1 putative sulfate permease 2 [Mollisia scopiformis]